MQHHTPLAPRDTLAEIQGALQRTRNALEKVRLKAIILRKKDKTPQEIRNQLMVSDRSVIEWVRRYNEGGISALTVTKGGRPEGNPKWDKDIFEDLAKEIDKGGYWSIPRMQEWIKREKRKEIPEQTVWYRMDQLHYSYKSSRPSPVQGSKEKQATFKKGGLSRSWSR